jgi:hypothetical protein
MHTPVMESPSSLPRFPESLLAVGVLAALLLAIGGVVEDSAGLPETAVASVNGQLLGRDNLDRLLERLEQQTGRPVGPAERAEVLSRLVDEELLLQQGLQLDIPRAEARLRSLIVQEVIRQAVAGSAALPVDEQALIDFHAANRGYFLRPERLSLRAFLLPDAEAAARLADALAADPQATPAGVTQDPALPAGSVSAAKLADYTGSPLAGRVASLAVGGTLREPLGEGRGVRVLQLLAREPGTDPAFAEIRAQVETEFRRRRDEAALQEYVEGLREAARIVRRESP